MAGINLAGPQARVLEKVLVDECTIRFDAQGTGDDVYVPIGQLVVEPAGDSSTLYDGACAVLPAQVRQGGPEGAAVLDTGKRAYRLLLPVDAPSIPRGAVATVTVATWDPNLVGAELTVAEEVLATMLVVRELAAERAR